MINKGGDKMFRLEDCSDGKLWTVPEYSRFSGLSGATIRKMMKSGAIRWVATGPRGKSKRIPHREILRLYGLAESAEGGRTPLDTERESQKPG